MAHPASILSRDPKLIGVNPYYAGIGSRSTPDYILNLMSAIAVHLAKLGWHLRSGGAEGADAAFELGASQVTDVGMAQNRTIYLPWDGAPGAFTYVGSEEEFAAAAQIASRHHPNWFRLGRGARRLQTRNVFQVLGHTLAVRSSFVVCWTPDGAERGVDTSISTGGTGQAIRIADANGIRVFNLKNMETQEAIQHIVLPHVAL